MRTKSAFLQLAAVLLSTGLGLQAATTTSSVNFSINHGVSVSTGSVSILGTTSNTTSTGPVSVNLPQFTAASGTLTGVSISITTASSTAGVYDTGTLSLLSGATYSSLLRADLTAGSVTKTGQHTANTASASLLNLLSLSGTQQATGAALNTTFTITDPAELAAFVGSGNFTTAFSTTDAISINTLLSVFSGVGVVAGGTYSGHVDVTYTYTPPVVYTVPSITSAPSAVAVSVGGTATFNVTAGGSAPFTYQWLKDGVAVSGATNSSLTLNSVQLSQAGTYSVTVTGPGGNVTSSGAALTVNPIIVAPQITSQPAGLTLSTGGALSLSVSATGSGPLSYQWYKDGVAISGATSSTLSFASAVIGDSGNYHVVVSNSGGIATSSSAVVVVTALAPVTTAPSIGTPPAAQSATIGSSVTFTVSVSGTSPFTYQWLKNGILILGANSSSLTLNPVQLSDTGTYSVTVSGPGGIVTSSGATLTVNPAPVVATPPQITSQPSGLTLSTGGALNLSVVASGTGPLSYQWYKNNVVVAGASASTLTIASASIVDSGTYHVVVSNTAGSATSSPAIVVVTAAPSSTTAPSIGAPPAAQTATVGSSVTFSVSVSGTAPFTYQWLKNGVAVSGATSSSFTLSPVQLSDAGIYSVSVSGPGGSITSSGAALVVLPAVVPSSAPTITSQPANATLSFGGSFTLTVGASGTGPITYQWYKNGSAISGATSASFTVASATTNDSGVYHVLVTNSVGSATSTPATVTVLAAPPANTAPSITGQPQSQTLTEGASLSLSVSATGSAPFTYQWRKDGVAISGANQATFSRSNLQVSDSGAYSVVISNVAGSVTSVSAQITIQAAPSVPVVDNPPANPPSNPPSTGGSSGDLPALVAPPLSQTVPVGSTVTFSIKPAGTGLTYQWLKDGAAILGATSFKLVLVNVQPSDSGDYSLVIQNAVGSVTTDAATLIVQGLPTVAAAPAGRLVNLSTRSQIGTGDNILIGGFVIGGSKSQTLLIRAVGPSLIKLGLPDAIAHPKLTVYHDGKPIMTNDNWMHSDVILPVLQMTQASGAFALDSGADDAALVATLQPGAYSVTVDGQDGGTGLGLIELYNVGTQQTTALGNDIVNLSSRGVVGKDSKVVIAGFVVGGNSPKTMLIRGVGPSLKPIGVADALVDPKLTIYHDGVAIKDNDDWSNGNDPVAIRRVSNSVGAFPLQDNSRDAVMLITLEPGAYSAIISSKTEKEGVALVEIYEVR